MSRALRERLEEIRPTCPHGRKIASLLAEPLVCAGTIKACECCQNAACKPSGHHTPWLCGECTPAAVHRAGIRGPEEPRHVLAELRTIEDRYDPSALDHEVGYIVGLDPALHPSEDTIVIGTRDNGGSVRFSYAGQPRSAADFYQRCRTNLEALMRSRSVPQWQRDAAEYARAFDWPSEIEKMVTAHHRRVTAAADIAVVRVLAAHPWYLHLLARTPRWKAYADGIR